MKHCILAKFTPEAKAQRAALLPRIREIFSAAADIPGVHGAEVIPNCVDRDNRYDVLHSSGYGPRGPAPVRCVRYAPPVEG